MVVLDASVIAKWFLQEPGSESALYYRDLHFKKKELIIAPSILVYELANLFRFKKDFSEKEIITLFDTLEEFKIGVVPLDFRDITKTVILARQKDITVYDAAYITLAINFNCKFITADKKLYEKTKDLGFIELLQK